MVQEKLTKGMTMSMPFQTVDLAERMEFLNSCEHEVNQLFSSGANKLLTCLVSSSFLDLRRLTLSIVVDTEVHIEKSGDGFEGAKIMNRRRS